MTVSKEQHATNFYYAEINFVLLRISWLYISYIGQCQIFTNPT